MRPSQDFLDGTMGMIDSAVHVGIRSCVGICDRKASERFAGAFAWRLLSLKPEGIEERIVLINITMRPAIDRNCIDVARRIESERRKHA